MAIYSIGIQIHNGIVVYLSVLYIESRPTANTTSIDVLPSKNQVLCKYCTHVSNYPSKNSLAVKKGTAKQSRIKT